MRTQNPKRSKQPAEVVRGIIIMGAALALVMLGFMWGMIYNSVGRNLVVVVVAMVVGATALWLSRSSSLRR